MRVKIERVSEVSTSEQSFRARLHLYVSYKPTKEDVEKWHEMQASDSISDWEPSWIPKFVFPNLMEIYREEWLPYPCGGQQPWVIVKQGACERGVISRLPYLVSGCLELDGKFAEKFELQNFPWDVQDLTLHVRSVAPANVCHLTLPFNANDVIELNEDASALTDWVVHPPQVEFVIKSSSPLSSYSQLNVSLKLERKWQGYVWRLMIILATITLAGLCCFGIDIINDAAERLGFIVTMLLTAVAYQYAISAELPQGLSYLTLLDKCMCVHYIH